MQSSKVCINEAGPSAVTVDFASAANWLIDSGRSYGYAYHKTLEHLGVEELTATPIVEADLVLAGSVASIKDHIPNLEQNIGQIAQLSTATDPKGFPVSGEYINRTLGLLTQRTIPELPDNATLMRAIGVITMPFADAVSTDDTRIYYGRPAPWGRLRDFWTTDADGRLLSRFGARDIGGLEIGADGLPARSHFSFDLPLDKTSLFRLRLMSQANSPSTIGEEVRRSLRHMLDQPERPVISPRPVGDDPVRFRATYPRTDLVELATLPHEGDTKYSDGFRRAVDMYLASCMADPATMEKVRRAHAQFRASVDPPYFDQ
jgi:hypothetical protein